MDPLTFSAKVGLWRKYTQCCKLLNEEPDTETNWMDNDLWGLGEREAIVAAMQEEVHSLDLRRDRYSQEVGLIWGAF